MKLKFSNTEPTSWRDLQDQVARFLNQADYYAKSPCTINTARGTVEVDVLVESPDELVKKIVCECKFWSTPVPKEKIHAFRTVVSDSGASLGLLISKSGFQSGAIEAAKYSNIQLMTWDEFLTMIQNKWILCRLKRLKEISAPLSVYTDYLDFPYEKLLPEDKARYNSAVNEYISLRSTCWMISKTDLLNEINEHVRWYRMEEFSSVEDYLNFLFDETERAISFYEEIVRHSGIEIDSSKFENLEGYLYMFLN